MVQIWKVFHASKQVCRHFLDEIVVVKDLYASIMTCSQGHMYTCSNLNAYLQWEALLKFLGRKYRATFVSSVMLIALV